MNSLPDTASLRHHGDRDAVGDVLDFAVNVRSDRPPSWLRDRLSGALDRLASYPSPEADAATRRTVAARHGRDPEEVLVLNGASEGFALLPTLRPRLAALVHPSYTEPEAALRTAGVPVRRVLLDARRGYRLDPDLVPDDADLVVLGNPTNPTSVLHPADTVRRLARPGRVLVVDEAFADAVPGEPESLAGSRLPGVLVMRSLTKTFSIAGLRAGYALGEPELLARLTAEREPWPVGTLTLEAVAACCEPEAVAWAEHDARELACHRDRLRDAMARLPDVEVTGPAAAPFLLAKVPDGHRLRERLLGCGIAVRRGDTFPGLSGDHIRVAVRQPELSDRLLSAMEDSL